MTSASSDDASVPKIIGAAPKTPATGSHPEVQKKEKPKCRIAGQALTASSETSAMSRRGSVRASAVSTPRYNRSATLVPRSACQRGSGAATGSSGTVVMGGNVSGLCHETVTAPHKKPPAGAYRHAGGSGSRFGGLPSCRCPDRLAAGRYRL